MTTIEKGGIILFYTILCFFISWILFSHGCSHNNPQPAIDNKIVDSMKILHQTIAKRGDTITFLKQKDEYNNSVIDDVVKMFQDADSSAKLNGALLSKTQKQLALAKAARDTAAQLRECDSLTNQLTLWRQRFDEADSQCNSYVFQTARELYNKDKAIETRDRQITDLLSLNQLADTSYRMLSRSIKPLPLLRGYLGATGTVGAYNSFGIHLDLLNRKDLMYKGAVRFGSGGFSYEAGASKLLSFKKH